MIARVKFDNLYHDAARFKISQCSRHGDVWASYLQPLMYEMYALFKSLLSIAKSPLSGVSKQWRSITITYLLI